MMPQDWREVKSERARPSGKTNSSPNPAPGNSGGGNPGGGHGGGGGRHWILQVIAIISALGSLASLLLKDKKKSEEVEFQSRLQETWRPPDVSADALLDIPGILEHNPTDSMYILMSRRISGTHVKVIAGTGDTALVEQIRQYAQLSEARTFLAEVRQHGIGLKTLLDEHGHASDAALREMTANLRTVRVLIRRGRELAYDAQRETNGFPLRAEQARQLGSGVKSMNGDVAMQLEQANQTLVFLDEYLKARDAGREALPNKGSFDAAIRRFGHSIVADNRYQAWDDGLLAQMKVLSRTIMSDETMHDGRMRMRRY